MTGPEMGAGTGGRVVGVGGGDVVVVVAGGAVVVVVAQPQGGCWPIVVAGGVPPVGPAPEPPG